MKINWKAYSPENRNIALYRIEKIINKYGFILDFKFFSDLEISLIIEAEGRKVMLMYAELNSYLKMDPFLPSHLSPAAECMILFNISFSQSKGDLKTDIPSVPG